ncbi:MAG: hypothetical protein HFE49_04165 [Clostridia bacterium]|nr:hypothetical protein [Clostridia bacterium]
MDNIIIRVVDLPYAVKGVTIPHTDCTYNIYINTKYSVETQNEILQHELRHIKNFDFDNFDNIKIIEQRANAV